jgi:hypothetical protein
MLTTIRFQDQEYKGRNIVLPEYGYVLIATTTLSAVLLDGNCNYTSEEAQTIDEQILFFVEDTEIGLPEEQFEQLLAQELL